MMSIMQEPLMRALPACMQAIKGMRKSAYGSYWELSTGCYGLASLPSIELQLGEFIVPLSPAQYIVQVRHSSLCMLSKLLCKQPFSPSRYPLLLSLRAPAAHPCCALWRALALQSACTSHEATGRPKACPSALDRRQLGDRLWSS
jgi:hypothetical protein